MNKKKQKNLNQKRLLKLKIDKDLTWENVEEITGYTRQNIDHAFRNNTQKTIQKVFEKLRTVWFFYAKPFDKNLAKKEVRDGNERTVDGTIKAGKLTKKALRKVLE